MTLQKFSLHLHLLLSHVIIMMVYSSPPIPDGFPPRKKSKEYFELALPSRSSDHPPKRACSHRFIRHSFGNTAGNPPVSVPYSPPPDCPAPWSTVILQVRASCHRGKQRDRIAAVWLGGAEILRTSTARPTGRPGIFWKARKDVTRYTSLLMRSDLSLIMMLENVVDRVFTGAYRVEVYLTYYPYVLRELVSTTLVDQKSSPAFNERIGLESEKAVADGIPSLDLPANMVLPISNDGGKGFWSRIRSESDVHGKKVKIPRNTRRAVLELYASSHGDDELWYSNAPDLYIELNNLTTRRGHGSFREMYVAIDGSVVASEIPFPVIFSGGINPLFWEPVVSIGAFDLPSYDIELTPFLGLLLDGKPHDFQIGIVEAIRYWLVGANLHLWLDQRPEKLYAKSVVSRAPSPSVKRKFKFNNLNGAFELRGSRLAVASGWVISGAGNLTTYVVRNLKFRSSIKFEEDGALKSVKHRIKSKTGMMVVSETGALVARRSVKRKFPLSVTTHTLPGKDEGSCLLVTNVSHAMQEKSKAVGEWVGRFGRSVSNAQDCTGWMAVAKDGALVSGAAETRQRLSYREGTECRLRTVAAVNGEVAADRTTSCVSSR